jgi:hypothetical protein
LKTKLSPNKNKQLKKRPELPRKKTMLLVMLPQKLMIRCSTLNSRLKHKAKEIKKKPLLLNGLHQLSQTSDELQ